MSYYQDPFFVNQGSLQFQDEPYFTNFQSEGDGHDLTAKDFNAWPTPLDTQQGQPTGYALRPSLEDSYLSPFLEPFKSSFIQTVGPAQLQLNGGSESPTDFQTCQSPKQDNRTLNLRDDSGNLSPLPSPSLVDTETYNTGKNISRTRIARSASGQQPKRGRPRNKRNQSSPSKDESAIQKSKDHHSAIERRYRDNLNGKMKQLHRVLLAAETNQTSTSPSKTSSSAGPALSSRVRKCDIMSKAVNYIHQSEVEIRHMDDEIKRLQDQVCIFQKLVHCDDCSMLKGMVELVDIQKP
ncbi:uncharacterized protein PV07_01191 [Cladophialophora immunda]|uniref:BHLH domain-containing protein n=1 Tax=Cladophialophora immunda TaxID=569365 RepID=A0A0D2CTD1_9EURO|nr:uncharacterized protein PV07_01191 [Cladophialophora immunda]KIW34413.1 hypothetical protein PV07_01191 [Cladophialophora immunda]OQV06920.1 Helix-loop-helix DNA-binding domain-containing protein [Cladophialophora immunda]